ncbi:MAG TPA: T9SS type A sorting domain-containing protein [Bacteroidia bacterium]|nr:T9SS type A sorting domain-containing protein [Bacteroidia bacterium]
MRSGSITFLNVCFFCLLVSVPDRILAQQTSFESEIQFSNTSVIKVLEKHSNDGYYIFQNATNIFGQNCPECISIHHIGLNGDLLSTKSIASPFANFIKLQKVIKTSDGNYLASGNLTTYNGFLIKLDSSFNVIWSNWYQLNSEYIQSRNIMQTNDGGILMMGVTSQNNSFLARFDSSGNGLWAKTYSNFNTSYSISKALEDPLGNFYIFQGYSLSPEHLLKVNSSGDIIWAEMFHDTISWIGPFLLDLMYDNFNNCLFLSSTNGLVKLDTAGTKLWDKQYSTNSFGTVGWLSGDNNNEITSVFNSLTDAGIIYNRFDSACNPITSIKYAWTDPPDGLNSIEAAEIIQTADSSLFVIGYHERYYPQNIIKYSYYFKTSGTYELGCHSFPWSQQIISTNSFSTETVSYTVLSKNILSTTFTPLSGTLLMPDTAVCAITSLPDINAGTTLVTFPNPSSGIINIKLSEHLMHSGNFKMEIFNSLGALIYNRVVIPDEIENPLQINLKTAGFYLIKISDSEFTTVSKVLIQR